MNAIVLDDGEGLWTKSGAKAQLAEVATAVVNRKRHETPSVPTAWRNVEVLILTRQQFALAEQDLQKVPRLQLLCNRGTGMSHLGLDALARRGIELRTTPGLAIQATAEHALAPALAVNHRIVELNVRAQDARS